MKNILLSIAFKVRAYIMRKYKSAKKYETQEDVMPISNKYGFDRGAPIDRYYIEKFLSQNSKFIKGKCLEIHDSAYTIKYGGKNVTKADALDVDEKNPQANIYADLTDVHMIPDNTYDTLLITHTVGMIDNFQKALSECWRVLKPNGTFLLTAGSIAPVMEKSPIYWRFTTASFEYLAKNIFKNSNKCVIRSYGNVYAARSFLAGMSVEDVSEDKLDFNDNRFPIIVTAVVQKK